jgi:hypothetical protein
MFCRAGLERGAFFFMLQIRGAASVELITGHA